MKNIVYILLPFILTGCITPAPMQVMTPFTVDDSLNLHTSYHANLNWEVGKELTNSKMTIIPYNANPLVGVMASLYDEYDRKNNPGKYIYRYGKAQQTVFMTSFRDILKENKIFKSINLTATKKQSVTQDKVVVNIFFKTTRISNEFENFRVTLSVKMDIKSLDNPDYSRNYLLQADPDLSFKDQQTDVSKKLAKELLLGIEDWYKNRKNKHA